MASNRERVSPSVDTRAPPRAAANLQQKGEMNAHKLRSASHAGDMVTDADIHHPRGHDNVHGHMHHGPPYGISYGKFNMQLSMVWPMVHMAP